MRTLNLLIALFALSTPAIAELSRDVRDYERVLIPIAIPVQQSSPTGIWRTEGIVSNTANVPVYIGQGDMHACQVECSERARTPADSNTRLYVTPSLTLPAESPQNPAAVFFVERPFESMVVFSNRLTDAATGKIFNLPSVRERDFAELSNVRLLSVPLDRGAVTLRIYDPYDREGLIVNVIFSDGVTRQILASAQLALRYEWEAPSSKDFPMYPAYSVVGDIRPLLPSSTNPIQVDIKCVGGEKGIWALATVTNTTGDVLMVYPQ